jgi:plasmid stabilization system protein ParE
MRPPEPGNGGAAGTTGDISILYVLPIHDGQPVKSARLSDVRRLHPSRIHYDLFSQARGNDILVLALWHTRRGETPEL